MQLKKTEAFALPTVLIASIVLLTVLLTSVTAVSSIRTALNDQYYKQLANEAAESGIAMAEACLKANNYTPTWGAGASGKPLRPNTGCSGGDACTSGTNCYVLNRGGVQTTYTVEAPIPGPNSQMISASSVVTLLRTSSGAAWKTYSTTASARLGADVSFNSVVFGYNAAAGGGAFFTTIAADGVLKAVGDNYYGQLGNGTTNPTLTPTPFNLPAGQRPASAYTNFLSVGKSMFVITDTGQVYGAGENGNGQLGDGTFVNRTTPVRFNLPAGKQAKYVGVLGHATFVLTTDNYLYGSGTCGAGIVGSGYLITGCTNISTPTAVALPTPNVNDPNTIPTTNMALDRSNVYIRMAGGRVYGWGANDRGQLANGTTTNSSVPVKIGTYGDAGQPKATQVTFDGDTVYIVDDSGVVKSAGFNFYGSQGNDRIPVINVNSGKCLDNNGFDGLNIQIYTCNGSAAQQWAWNEDFSIQNLNNNKCLDNANGDGTTIRLWTCNGSASQKFGLDVNNFVYNWQSARCLENAGADGVTVRLWTCNGTAAQKWKLPETTTTLLPFSLPGAAGKAIKVATDQWFASVLTDTGEVWSAGMNDQGQLGNAKTTVAQAMPVKMILPAGVKAVDIYSTSYGGLGSPSSNTYAVGDDGKVYGVGSNGYGQLGDGTTTGRTAPVAMQVFDGSAVRAQQVQSGYGTTVILTTNGKVYTVGNNSNGQLGDGTTTNSSTPKANRYTNVLPLTIF
jgi:alpha-tubulin suppressor-like RCC1 family protein